MDKNSTVIEDLLHTDNNCWGIMIYITLIILMLHINIKETLEEVRDINDKFKDVCNNESKQDFVGDLLEYYCKVIAKYIWGL